MAHFAKLGLDNVVCHVTPVDNIRCMTRGGIEKEELGIQYLIGVHGHENWKQCSYSARCGVKINLETGEPTGEPGFRANYPGIGWYYNSEHDIFHPARPTDVNGVSCASYTLNTTTGQWDPPVARPTLSGDDLAVYEWDEAAYQADNTQGWVLVTPE